MAMAHIASRVFDRELKKGSAELLILSLVEARPRHGYEISKLIEARSNGAVKFNVASLYPLLYRLEQRGWIQGRWVEKAGQRRRLAHLNLDPAREVVIVEELEQHLADYYAEVLAGGATEAEAYRRSLAELQNSEALWR